MVIVVGAGLAGMSAALHLAERGVPVLLCEAHPDWLGGRTRARDPYTFTWNGERHTQSFDHGQHCIWTQYWNMRALLERSVFTSCTMLSRSIRRSGLLLRGTRCS